jgi:hypothetical protein
MAEETLMTISILARDLPREDARTIAKQLRDGVLLNLLAEMERRGISADDLDGLLTVFAPTLTFALPVRAEKADGD